MRAPPPPSHNFLLDTSGFRSDFVIVLVFTKNILVNSAVLDEKTITKNPCVFAKCGSPPFAGFEDFLLHLMLNFTEC